MSVFNRPGKEPSFDVGDAGARVPEHKPRERTADEKAERARTIASNLAHHDELVSNAVANMHAAGAARDRTGWTTARRAADTGVSQISAMVDTALAAATVATDAGVRRFLASVEQLLAGANALVETAPAAPDLRVPVVTCADALLGVLLPAEYAGEPEAAYAAAERAVGAWFVNRMTYSDITAFQAIWHEHKDHEIARRFARFGRVRQDRLLALVADSKVKARARAMDAAQHKPRRDAADSGTGRPAALASGDSLTAAGPAPASKTAANARVAADRPAPTAELNANSHGDAADATTVTPTPPAVAPTAILEPRGEAIAATVPGVIYEGSGRFRVASRERQLDVTIQFGSTAPRTRRSAGDAVVVEVPTGLGEAEFAETVAGQLRALHEPPASPSAGGGEPLPSDVRADMEGALGADFSGVRIHQADAQAEAVGALAFTRGSDIFFAPGRFDPHSVPGRELLGHELAHVAQQAEGRVPATAQINGVATNDDPALEQEADARGAHAVTAGSRTTSSGTLAKPAATGAAQAKRDTSNPGAHDHQQPVMSDPDRVVDTTGAPIQRQEGKNPSKKQRIPYKIRITRPMTGEELKVAAHLQVFGAVIGSDWHNVKDRYNVADSPVEILIDVELFHRGRGVANAARGIDTDASGAVVGADARAKDFETGPGSDQRAALLAEIDRRYEVASGVAPGTKITPGEPGRAELWRSIRDEVLFQNAYIANLPDKVKALFRVGIAGRELTPADYDQLFRIAKKIEGLPPGQAADCASKVAASTTSLDQLEAGIESYRSQLAAREQAGNERTAVQNKLLGLEEVYKLYRQYRATPTEAAPGMGEQLEQQLRRHGFASIAELTSYISRFEQAFEDSAAEITLDILAKYAGKLYKESQRYQDPAVVNDLHGKLGGFRAQHQELDKSSKIYSAEVWKAQHDHDAEVRRLPSNGGIAAKPPTREQVEAKHKAEAAKANAEAQIKELSKDYPIFAEDELPVDKRLDKTALAQASEAELAGVLQAHIAHRQSAVSGARGQLEGKHELIYKMSKLMPAFYAQMGIQPGSIHDQIIQDKMHSDAVATIVTGVLVAIVTVALTVVSLGAATPAVLAAGASIGAAGISTYMAYDEYKQYTEGHAIAEAGFANDPSVTWLVLAIVGAGADMASAASVISKLAPAAKALDAEGKLIDFTRAVEALQRSNEIDEKIAAAADNAAAARTSYAAAKQQFKADLRLAASGARGALGPFTDPTVFRGLVKMAVAKLREGINSLEVFIEQLKKARIEAKLGEMSPEELVKAKAAWAQADILRNQVKDPAVLDMLLELRLDPTALEKFADLDVAALQKFAALEPEVLQKFARLRYADMLAKFGACDAEGLAKLATLDSSVLEKFGGWDARTVKNISGLDTPDIEKIARLKVAPGQAVEGALSQFHSEQFRMGSEVFQLDSAGMKHILERHHPQFWDGSVKLEQSFLDPRMSMSEVQDAIRDVMRQNRDNLIKLGTNTRFQISGAYGGNTYTLGINRGRVAQFYPK